MGDAKGISDEQEAEVAGSGVDEAVGEGRGSRVWKGGAEGQDGVVIGQGIKCADSKKGSDDTPRQETVWLNTGVTPQDSVQSCKRNQGHHSSTGGGNVD